DEEDPEQLAPVHCPSIGRNRDVVKARSARRSHGLPGMDVDRQETPLAQRSAEARTLQDFGAEHGSGPATPLPRSGSGGDKLSGVDPPTPPLADGKAGPSARPGGLPPLRCRFDHWHPPQPVRAATGNPMRSYGPPPYHCADCAAARPPATRPDYWIEYETPGHAMLAGPRPPRGKRFPPRWRRLRHAPGRPQ